MIISAEREEKGMACAVMIRDIVKNRKLIKELAHNDFKKNLPVHILE